MRVHRFRATVEQEGKTATGLQVPDDVVAALGAGKRPRVAITIGPHTYRTTVASMGGRFVVPLAAQHRQAAGVVGGDDVEVALVLDDAPRTVDVPADLADALNPTARQHFDGLSYTHRKEWVRWVEEAKKPETRARRLAKTVEAMEAGRGTSGH